MIYLVSIIAILLLMVGLLACLLHKECLESREAGQAACKFREQHYFEEKSANYWQNSSKGWRERYSAAINVEKSMKQETYKSTTDGNIPLSFTGRHLLQSLREVTTAAIAAGDWHTDGDALSRVRAKLARYMSELENKSATDMCYKAPPTDWAALVAGVSGVKQPGPESPGCKPAEYAHKDTPLTVEQLHALQAYIRHAAWAVVHCDGKAIDRASAELFRAFRR